MTTTTTTKTQRVGLIKDIHNARERLRRAKLARDKADVAGQAAAAQRVVDAQAALDALLHPTIAAAVAAAPAPTPLEAAAEAHPTDQALVSATTRAPDAVAPARDAAPSLMPPAPPFTAVAFQQARLDRVGALRQRVQRDERALGVDHPETVAVRNELAAVLADVAGLTDAEVAELRARAALPPPPRPVIDEANDVEPPRRGAWGKLTASPERLAAADEPAPTKPKRARKAAATSAPAAAKSEYGRPGTAAELYRRSIMEGLSDAACFARVKAELGDKAAGKDTYPGWYRAQLRKNGKNPPVSPAASPKTNGTSN